MRPIFQILADGLDVTANIADRLLSLTLQEAAEDDSDSVELRLDDRQIGGAYASFPEIGTEFQVLLGYAETGLVDMGRFEVDEVRYRSPPATMEVRAKTAKMQGAFRSPEAKSFHEKTLGEIVEEVAGAHGFEAAVDGELASIEIPHVDQTDESPMAFLVRLAREHDAIARPINGRIVVTKRGSGKAATGAALPEYRLASTDCNSWTFSHTARTVGGASAGGGYGSDEAPEKKGGVRAIYWDVEKQEVVERTEGEEPYQNLRWSGSDEETAKAAAETVKRERERKEKDFSFSRTGDPALIADQKLILIGFRPELPTEWRLMRVTHRLDSNGYRTDATAELWGSE